MKKLFVILTAITSLAMLPSVSHAFCTQTDEIVSVVVLPGAGVSSIDVRSSTPGSTTFRFTTADNKVLDAATNAEASHQQVRVVGGTVFSICGVVVGGLSAGGTVASITLAP